MWQGGDAENRSAPRRRDGCSEATRSRGDPGACQASKLTNILVTPFA
uniref:Uncharacterized protein n=1 Tax=Arundo donax TaxID=35708 RepID=A0A0A9A1F8_ARUDO